MRNDQVEVKVNYIHPLRMMTAAKKEPKMVVEEENRSLINLDYMSYEFALKVEISDGERPLQWRILPMLDCQFMRNLTWNWGAANFLVHDNGKRNKELDADYLERYFDRDLYDDSSWRLKSEIKERLREKIDEAISNCIISIVQKERAIIEK